MADNFYPVPEDPAYLVHEIRRLQDTDPASSTQTFNPLIEKLLESMEYLNLNKTPATRKVNGKALSADITLGAADVGARLDTWIPSATDMDIAPEMHRMWFRGKNLGTSFTDAQKAAIQVGTFDDLFLGDYWKIGGVTWRIVDMDYWYNCGDTAFKRHHLVIMPDTSLYSAKMNPTSTTEGGYFGSEMHTTNLEQAKTQIKNAFGEENVLTYREYLINAVADGAPAGGTYVDTSVILPNEPMMYGCYNAAAHSASSGDCSVSQLALFRVAPKFRIPNGNGTRSSTATWLRDIVDETQFAAASYIGAARLRPAANSLGVRPVFPIG